MKNFNLKRFIIEMLIYAVIFGVIMYFVEYKDVQKSIIYWIFYGFSMSIFNSFILPKLQKKK
jgi:uncharacterized membrane-anchored protein YitT (DUF2179 family)